MPVEPDGSRPERPESQPSSEALTEPSAPMAALSRWLQRALGRGQEHTLKEALQEMLDEHENTVASAESEELTLLRNMVAFGEIKVSDVMIPRTDIVAAPETADLEEIKQLIAKERHTRVPLYGESLDQVTGFLHIKDFLMCLVSLECGFDLPSLRRDILFVPASMKIIDLLLKMRVSSCHIAIVVDEYGGTDGLVTMEDLFEEIVGEIHDEHDEGETEPELKWVSDRVLEADARVEVEALMEQMQVNLINGHSIDDFDTVGGLLFSHLGRIPAKGEVINYGDGIKFEILSADPRRIRKVRIVRSA